MFQIVGDVADPSGTGMRGNTHGFQLSRSALARPIVRWRDYFLTVDIYDEPGSGAISAHLYCPMCAQRASAGSAKHNALMISARNKKIELDFYREPRFSGLQNAELLAKLRTDLLPNTEMWKRVYRESFPALSIEAFGCSWEGEFGICSWRVQIDNNHARDI